MSIGKKYMIIKTVSENATLSFLLNEVFLITLLGTKYILLGWRTRLAKKMYLNRLGAFRTTYVGIIIIK